MPATVQTVEELIHEIAPWETAESYDNVGLLVGERSREISRVLVALDATMDVVQEAESIGAELIVTHHPLFFHARKNLVEEDPEAKIVCEMIRHGISLISAHTNLDQTFFSGSAACARLLKLWNIRKEGFLFLGELESPCTAETLQKQVNDALPMASARLYGNGQKTITTLAVCGGAYDEGWQDAMALGAQALLTGEVRHHNALNCVMSGFVLIDGGHYGTEAPLVPALAEYLQNALYRVKCSVRVYPSHSAPFGSV